MSVTHTAPILDGICSASKEYGAWRGFTAQARVSGLTSASDAIINEAIAYAEASPTLPTIGDVHGTYTNLILKAVTGEIYRDHTGVVDLTFEYVPISEYEGLGILHPEATLQQVETQTDRIGQSLYTQHTYPATDLDFPSETLQQGGSVTVDSQSFILRATLKRQLTFPMVDVSTWLGYLNATTWQGFGAGLWKCIECQPRLWDASTTPYTYMVDFAFQLNRQGWNPSIVFIDSRDGKPPYGLVFNVGYKTFVWNDTREFNELFPTPADYV